MADYLYNIRQGESGTFNISAYDEGTPIQVDGTDILNIIVSLVMNGQIVETIIKNGSISYDSNGDIVVTDGADTGQMTVSGNIITLSIDRDKTRMWSAGIMKAVVTIKKSDPVLGTTYIDFEVPNFILVLNSENKKFKL